MIRVCVAGATGWAGSALASGISRSDDLQLVSGVSRTHAGTPLESPPGVEGMEVPVFATVEEALESPPDVLVEYTKLDVAKGHILTALRRGCSVVVGTSGLTGEDYEEISRVATEEEQGVLAAGNFALTAVLAQKFAEIAARYVPHWEVIDYAHAGKKDVPSGTVRELVSRLSGVRESAENLPTDSLLGPTATRGARMDGTQVHAVRLPGYLISFETLFGMPDQRLTIRHDSGSSAEPYVDGALLAIRHVGELTGLHRGLDSVMEF